MFLGGMYCSDCPETVRSRLSKIDGVVEVLVTNYIETAYGVVQIFYDSNRVSRDEVLAKLGPPYYAILLEDRDPRREQILLRYTEIYVC
jgi:copper chaperone CopZ